MSLSKTYYTCDDCEWAGPFADTREHYDETGHDAFSRRGEDEPEVLPVPYVPVPYPVPCNHTFPYWSVIPPTHCPRCGAYLGGYYQPRPYGQRWYPNTQPYTTPYNNQITFPGDSGTVVINTTEKVPR